MMTKLLVIGASSPLGQTVVDTILTESEAEITLFDSHLNVEDVTDENREQVVTGDLFDNAQLDGALRGQDVVFMTDNGREVAQKAEAVVAGMKRTGVTRLIMVSSMGIYDEIPAEINNEGNLSNNPDLAPYRKAADTVENAGLDFTILRPAWFDNGLDTDYEITHKGEPAGGRAVSRKSIAAIVLKIVEDPQNFQTESIGINRPE